MSKRKLYLFNPHSDLALANGDSNYMPPTSARQMAADLALLPAWYAESGSVVLAPSAYNHAFLKQMQERLPLPVELITEAEVASTDVLIPVVDALIPSPWGWNPALRKHLQSLGMPSANLPSLDFLATYRHLSHRSRAVELLPRLQLNEYFCGKSSYLTEPADWQSFVEGHEACLLKAPLSGSGKGLNWCKGTFTSFISGWCTHVAALQGGVVAEPIYTKVEDFAMEFLADGTGKVVFAGYSFFATGSSGAYEGNLLLSDEEIERRLSLYVPLVALQMLRVRLEKELSTLLDASYSGYLGVDMMICHFPAEAPEFLPGAPVYRIHPCVEINLRMNMGVIARLFYDRYVNPGSSGVYQVSCSPSQDEALRAHRQMEAEQPLRIENGKLISGYLSLVPVTAQSRYRAFVMISVGNIITNR